MAGRGIRELLRLSVADWMFFIGAYTDFSGNGEDGTPQGTVELGRRIGQVVSVKAQAAGDRVTTAFSLASDLAWSFECTMVSRDGGGGGNGRIFEGGSVACWYNEANDRISWTCGTQLNTSNGTVIPGIPIHVIGTKDAAGNGTIYLDGQPEVSGPVNTGGPTDLIILDRVALDRTLVGDLFLLRFILDEVSDDEATRLFEHSRLQLWPGATKRSGIVSPVV